MRVPEPVVDAARIAFVGAGALAIGALCCLAASAWLVEAGVACARQRVGSSGRKTTPA